MSHGVGGDDVAGDDKTVRQEPSPKRVRLGALQARVEAFGAVIALDEPPALVNVDRTLAARLGLQGGSAWDKPDPGLDVVALRSPNEVHVSVTERCAAGCTGCYMDAQPQGHAPSLGTLKERLSALAELGVFRVAFGGGEPLSRSDLGELALHARQVGLEPTLTTSGIGLTARKASELTGFAQVNVSYDGPGDVYEGVRGWDGAQLAEAALAQLQQAGVAFGVNTVLTKQSFGRLGDIAARAAALGARELQLIRFKPSGRGKLDYLSQRLSAVQVDAFAATLRALVDQALLAVRIDCALVPFLSRDATLRPEQLQQFAVSGCEAGRSLMSVSAKGAVAPCSFFRPEESATGQGGAEQGDTAPAGKKLDEQTWQTDAQLQRFREYYTKAPEPCASCPLRAVCRGGCRVVTAHLKATPWAPDPECPRVRAAAERASQARQPSRTTPPKRSAQFSG